MHRATPAAARAACRGGAAKVMMLRPTRVAAPLRTAASRNSQPSMFGPAQRRMFAATTALHQPVKTMNMADVGEGIKEVEVLNWEVSVGDEVEEFQKLCDVQSDKATVEITARHSGKITKIYTAQGDMQQVGAGLVDIEVSGGADEAPPTPTPAAATPAAKKSGGSGVLSMKMADVGEGIKEVEVLGWDVSEGDTVEEFQKLCDVQSDKATVEITSKYAGKIVKIYTPAGSMQQVGQTLIDIEGEGGDDEPAPAATPAAASTPSAAKPAAAAPKAGGGGFQHGDAARKVLCSPFVRAEARRQGVDLASVTPSGPGGRVTKEDLQKYISSGAAAAPAAAAATPSAPTPTGAPSAPGVTGGPVWSAEDRTIKITGITKAMVKSMSASLSIPTFGASDEVNLNALVDARAMMKPVAEKKGVKLSYMPFFIKAASLAMREYPMVNAQLNADVTEITYKGQHNIGVAMDTAQGLIVPNIKDVQSKNILQIAADLNGLQERGAAGKLTGDDLKGGTFTLSNIGAIGGTYVAPIIFPPQVAIGALGKVVKIPKYDDKGNVVPVNTLYITWTADHRVIDGATMVRYSNLWKAYLENPAMMLLATA